MRKTKKRYIIMIIILVCIMLFLINSMKYDFLQEDLLFFQFFNSQNQSRNTSNIKQKVIEEKIETEETSTNIKKIYFHVQYKNRNLKTVNLAETVDNKTLIYEKIAPGTSGRFDILLTSNKDLNYKIEFESKSEKPTNLQFYTSENGKSYHTLEELGEDLTGMVLRKEEKTIPVYWKWEYEISEEQNKQDTLEAEKIREYHFLIYVQGY